MHIYKEKFNWCSRAFYHMQVLECIAAFAMKNVVFNTKFFKIALSAMRNFFKVDHCLAVHSKDSHILVWYIYHVYVNNVMVSFVIHRNVLPGTCCCHDCQADYQGPWALCYMLGDPYITSIHVFPMMNVGVHESSLPVAHPGYQILSDILFRLGLIANCSHTVQYLDCSDLNWRCNHYHLFWHCMTLLVLMCR